MGAPFAEIEDAARKPFRVQAEPQHVDFAGYQMLRNSRYQHADSLVR